MAWPNPIPCANCWPTGGRRRDRGAAFEAPGDGGRVAAQGVAPLAGSAAADRDIGLFFREFGRPGSRWTQRFPRWTFRPIARRCWPGGIRKGSRRWPTRPGSVTLQGLRTPGGASVELERLSVTAFRLRSKTSDFELNVDGKVTLDAHGAGPSTGVTRAPRAIRVTGGVGDSRVDARVAFALGGRTGGGLPGCLERARRQSDL